jgi:predicted ATPase
MPAFIQSMRVRGFGCIKDTALENLTRLHAFIGPNDSGKSMLLRALRVAFTPSLFGTEVAPIKLWSDGEILLNNSTGATLQHSSNRGNLTTGGAQGVTGGLAARLLRLDADVLRRPSQLIPSDQELTLDSDRGSGLAGVYDAIVNRDVTRFLAIGDRVRQLFPTIKAIGFRNPTASQKELEFELVDGTRVPASLMSEGLLYYLAFAALPHLAPTRLLLVEEPENGLHPSRVQEIMRILREVSLETQVILATHSPLVINELSGDEVHVITRDATEGTRARLLKDTPHFDERSKVYALGELWLSYADGATEAPLLQGTPAA